MKAALFGIGLGLGWASMTASGLENPARGAVVFVCILAIILAWFTGKRRGYAIANASATAMAVSTSHAAAEALSQANAHGGNSSVNLQVVLPGQSEPIEVKRFVKEDPILIQQEQQILEISPDDYEETLEKMLAGEEVMQAEQAEND